MFKIPTSPFFKNSRLKVSFGSKFHHWIWITFGFRCDVLTYRILLSTIHPKKTGVISHWNIACASGSVSASHHHPHPKSRNQELNFRPKNHVNLKQTRCTLMIVLMHVGRLKQIHLKNCSMIVIDHQEAYYFHLFSDMFSDIHQKVTCVWYTVFMSTKN